MGFLFKKKEDKYVNKGHFSSFYRWVTDFVNYVHDEIEKSAMWIEHLVRRTDEIEKSHKDHIEATRRYLEYTERWIKSLHESGKKSEKEVEKTKGFVIELYKQHKELVKTLVEMKEENNRLKVRIEEIVSQMTRQVSQSDTKSVTDSVTVTQMTPMTRIEGTKREKNTDKKEEISDTRVSQTVSQSVTDSVTKQEIRENSEEKGPRVAKKSTGKLNKETKSDEWSMVNILSELNLSEKRTVYLMIHEKEPMSYQKISEKLDMNYSTVKNIIYRLRKRGVPINDRLNRRGEKEFYVPENIRIALKSDN